VGSAVISPAVRAPGSLMTGSSATCAALSPCWDPREVPAAPVPAEDRHCCGPGTRHSRCGRRKEKGSAANRQIEAPHGTWSVPNAPLKYRTLGWMVVVRSGAVERLMTPPDALPYRLDHGAAQQLHAPDVVQVDIGELALAIGKRLGNSVEQDLESADTEGGAGTEAANREGFVER